MGTYLLCGIATRLVVREARYKTDRILEGIGKEIDLNIYNVDEDSEEYLVLTIKEDVFEKYAIPFVMEQLEFKNDDEDVKEDLSKLESLKGKSYDNLMEFAERRSCCSFQMLKGSPACNCVSYLGNDMRISIYADIFSYIRKSILASSTNPIKTACVVSIIG